MPLSDREQRVCRALEARAARMREDLARYVALPTGQNFTPGLDELRNVMIDCLRALGASIEVVPGAAKPPWLTLPNQQNVGRQAIPPTLVARHPSRATQPRILIAGHLDTVHDPHGPFRQLSFSPDGRTATGPGAVDMKGGLVIALAALGAVAECGVDLNWTFLLNSDEESGSFHSFDAIVNESQRHDIGLVLEPALPDGSLVVERMGSGQFKIEVFGRSAHVGRDFARGVSAVSRLSQINLHLAKMSKPDEGVIVNVGPLLGGAVTNAVPDYAACWGNVRFDNDKTAHEMECDFGALATADDAMPRVVVHHLFNRPAKPLTDLVRRLAEQARETASVLGQQLPFAKTGGVCDGNIMQSAGLPTIDTLGVRGGNLHRPDEFIDLASLVERAQLLALLLMRLADQPRS